MRIFTTLEAFRPEISFPLFLALGNFDGLHLGHQEILNQAVKEAGRSGGKAAVLTFQEHPQQILQPRAGAPRLLASPLHKLWLLREMKVDFCFFLPFTKEFSQLEPEVFVRQILKERLKVRKVYMGFNARFGHQRKGDANLMRQAARKLAFEFEEIPSVKIQNQSVSSSAIREMVSQGRLDEVKIYLGRPFSVLGKVVKGDGRGALLGFPTANLEVTGCILPPQGVYPVQVRAVSLFLKPEGGGRERLGGGAEGPWYRGVLNYGCSPTFKEEPSSNPRMEVHILDFQGDLYGKELEIVFYSRLREERKFNSPEELKTQIAADISHAERYFASLPSGKKNGKFG